MPWEDGSRALIARLLATLTTTFQPLRSVAACSEGPLRPAISFSLLTLVPSLLSWGVIPLTHKLNFGPSFVLTIAPGTTEAGLWSDLLQAVGLGFSLGGVTWLSWTVPFVSLTGAFASEAHRDSARIAAWRTSLYRAWVVPTGLTLLSLGAWAAPTDPSLVLSQLLLLALQVAPRVLLIIHCHSTARHLGASSLGALAVALVPLAVEATLGALLWNYATPLLPRPPAG